MRASIRSAGKNGTRLRSRDGDPTWRWLAFLWLALISYHALKAFVGGTKAISNLQAAFSYLFKRQLRGYMTSRFGISQNAPEEAFDRISQNFMTRGEKLYGSRWTYVQSVQDHDQFQVHVTKCLFNDFCRAHGVPELTALFCALDGVWIEELHKGRYKTHFERPTTLAAGDDVCRFQFSREKGRGLNP